MFTWPRWDLAYNRDDWDTLDGVIGIGERYFVLPHPFLVSTFCAFL